MLGLESITNSKLTKITQQEKIYIEENYVDIYTGTQRSLEKGTSAKFRLPKSAAKLAGSHPDKEEELQLLSMTVRVEESVEFPVTVSKAAPPSVMTASSLEKSRRSSTMKLSPPLLVLLLSRE